MSTELSRIAELARQDRKRQFLSIAHLITPDALTSAYHALRKDASPGIDRVTHEEYGRKLKENIADLHARLKEQRYSAQPLKRVYIPKEDGKQRPISIPSLEDKVAQKAAVTILETIYEQDFLPVSYGFRPGRSTHDALNEIGRVICRRRTEYVLEADICAYFDSIVRENLMALIERRVKDGSMLRLIQKWINVGVIDNGRLLVTETGTGQGQTISPLLANVYLHNVLDLWFEGAVKPLLRGSAELIRYCDDFVICFRYKDDAERTLDALTKRFAKYGLTLHPEKTRLIAFGRQALESWEHGGRKPDTFDFLGFSHFCARSLKGNFTIHISTMRKRLRRAATRISEWCRAHRHNPVADQQKALNKKLAGHYGYYGRPTNLRALWRFHRLVRRIWKKWLNSRTRGKTLTWARYARILERYPLLRPRITHAWSTK